jgi:hypothetical protein
MKIKVEKSGDTKNKYSANQGLSDAKALSAYSQIIGTLRKNKSLLGLGLCCNSQPDALFHQGSKPCRL